MPGILPVGHQAIDRDRSFQPEVKNLSQLLVEGIDEPIAIAPGGGSHEPSLAAQWAPAPLWRN